MEKEFVPYEIALALKELGFDEPCFGYYVLERNGDYKLYDKCEVKTYFTYIKVPTFSQAFRCFREKYNLIFQINYLFNGNYQVVIHKNTHEYMELIQSLNSACVYEIVDNYSYEEAELECLKKLIELCENK